MRELYKDRRWNAVVGATNAGLAACAVVVVLALTLGRTSGDRVPVWVLAVMAVGALAASGGVLIWYVTRLEVTKRGETLEVRGPIRSHRVDRNLIVDLAPTQFMNGTYCVSFVLARGEPVRVLAVPFRRRDALLAALPHLEHVVGNERRTRDRTGRLLSVNVVRGGSTAVVDWSVWVMRPRLPLSRPRLIASGLDKESATALRDEVCDRIHDTRRWRPPTSPGQR